MPAMTRLQAEAIIRAAYPHHRGCAVLALAVLDAFAELDADEVSAMLTDEGVFRLAAAVTDEQLKIGRKMAKEMEETRKVEARQRRRSFRVHVSEEGPDDAA